MKNIYIAIVSMLLIVNPTSADSFKSQSELRAFADSIMEKAGSGDIAGAFDAMEPYTIIPKQEFQSAALQSKAQRDQYGVRYGKSIGYEFISETSKGESLVQFVYIEKTENHALPWSFYFYKSPNGWVLNSFQWNDQLPLVFSFD
jgi:hypothetical protein